MMKEEELFNLFEEKGIPHEGLPYLLAALQQAEKTVGDIDAEAWETLGILVSASGDLSAYQYERRLRTLEKSIPLKMRQVRYLVNSLRMVHMATQMGSSRGTNPVRAEGDPKRMFGG